MNIKFKLTFRFTLIVAGILLGSFYIVYENYANFRGNSFYERMNDRAHYITNAFLDLDGMDEKTIQTLNNYTLSISPNLRVSLYDSLGNLKQPIGVPIAMKADWRAKLQSNNYVEEQISDTQYICFVDRNHHQTIYVVAAAYDRTGFKKLDYLKNLFSLIWIISVVTTAFAGWVFAKVSLHPMNQVVKEVQNITATELHNRLTIHNPKDEIALLSRTFNSMLDRLESSFELQKNFVSNASHEFRTPLTSIKGQIQVALLKNRTALEYEKLLSSLNDDINNIISLLNALQELAKANADFPSRSFYPIPILDTVIDAQNDLLKNKPHYSVDIVVEEAPDEDMNRIVCNGDVNLLKSAITNLIDNGCKFSADHAVKIKIGFTLNKIKIVFSDEGVGIPEESLPHIFEPFFRGNDTRNVYGHGIGLSLVKRIIEWHNGTIEVSSEYGKGSVFIVTLPNINDLKL